MSVSPAAGRQDVTCSTTPASSPVCAIVLGSSRMIWPTCMALKSRAQPPDSSPSGQALQLRPKLPAGRAGSADVQPWRPSHLTETTWLASAACPQNVPACRVAVQPYSLKFNHLTLAGSA